MLLILLIADLCSEAVDIPNWLWTILVIYWIFFSGGIYASRS